MRRNQERLTVHGHLKGDHNHDQMHVRIEHVNQIVIVSPLERKQGLSTPISNTNRKDSVLERSKVNDTLARNLMVIERVIVTLMCFLAMETLIWKCI